MKLQMKPHNSDGLLITFCGLDGCGKTTLINKLKDYIEQLNIQVCLTKQPTPFVRKSVIFRNYMDSENHDDYDYRAVSLMAASDRIQHSNKVILPEIQKGKVVISDRYFYSCLANLQARGYEKDQWIYEIAKDIPRPDISFFLDVDVETAVWRVRQRAEEKDRYIDMQLQYRLRENYLKIAKENDGIIIPSSNSPEKTFKYIKEKISAVLQRI